MNQKIKGISQELLSSLYLQEKKSLKEIAIQLNCSSQTVLNYLKSFGIQRRTVSESLLGREVKWANKIGKSHKGRSLSSEHKQKISNTRLSLNIPSWNKGLTKAENSDRVSYGCKNENHWNWKGGISSEKIKLRQTSEYKLWRKKCFQRDNYSCQDCGLSECYLNVHHIIPFSLLVDTNQNLFNLENGITLCKLCHKKRHQ